MQQVALRLSSLNKRLARTDDFSFWDEILEAGHLHRVEARARTERAREAHARGVAVAELGESARAAL